MKATLKRIGDGIMLFGGLVGLAYLPVDLIELPATYPWFGKVIDMIDRHDLITAFAFACVFYIIWIRLRPLYEERQRRKTNRWAKERASVAIWEAGCFLTSTPLNEYNNTHAAISAAQDLLYYADSSVLKLEHDTPAATSLRYFGQGKRATIDDRVEMAELLRFSELKRQGWASAAARINREHAGLATS